MPSAEDNVGLLEENAAKRKAKLLELKNRRNKKAEDGDEDRGKQSEQPLPATKVLFRNYQPDSGLLSELTLEPSKPGDVDSLIEEQLEKAMETAQQGSNVELDSLAPRKVTSDLKRGIQDKLDALEESTERAIIALTRERLRGSDNLAEAVAMAAPDS